MNQRVRESKSRALPLGDDPIFYKALNSIALPIGRFSKMDRKMGLEPITYRNVNLLEVPLLTYINIITYIFKKSNFYLLDTTKRKLICSQSRKPFRQKSDQVDSTGFEPVPSLRRICCMCLSRGSRIRTDDLVIPNHASYQTGPCPVSSERGIRTLDPRLIRAMR